MTGKTSPSRVTFSQRSWVALTLAACVAGCFAGAPLWLGILSFIVLVLPVLSLLVREYASTNHATTLDDIDIFIWTLIGLLAMALAGGALSALVSFLLIGPMWAFARKRTGLALEIAVLSLFSYAVSILAGFLGWSDVVPFHWRAMIAPLSIAALVQTVVLFWACAPSASNELGGVKTFLDGTSSKSPEASLELNLPMLLVDVAPEGRIRRIEGDEALLWEGLEAGRIADAALVKERGDRLVAPDGGAFKVIEAAHTDGGRWIGLVPDDVLQSEDSENLAKLETAMAKVEEAELALSERTAFFAGLGHDLKTPLNAILGFADLMKAEVRGPLPEAYKDYPAIIHESGQDLMLLVDDILDLAKAEASSHRLDMEPVDLVASAASVVRQLQDQADRADVRLSLNEDEEVWAEADARAVRQIWQNLISNAIKYSDKDGVVTLSAGKAAGAVAISVKDRGAGMDEADLERIAKPFAQGDNAKGRAGTGLGLAVVKRFAELHGGKVLIDTAPGKGTQVRVTLPAAEISSIPQIDDAAQ